MKQIDDNNITKDYLAKHFSLVYFALIYLILGMFILILSVQPIFENIDFNLKLIFCCIINIPITYVIYIIFKTIYINKSKKFLIYNDEIINTYNKLESFDDSTIKMTYIYLKDGNYFKLDSKKGSYEKGSQVYSIRDTKGKVYWLYPKSDYTYKGVKEVLELVPYIQQNNTFNSKYILTKDIVIKDINAAANSLTKYLGFIFLILVSLSASRYLGNPLPFLICTPIVIFVLTRKVDTNIYVESAKVKDVTVRENTKILDVVFEGGEQAAVTYRGFINNGDEVHVIRTVKDKKAVAVYPKNIFDIKF